MTEEEIKELAREYVDKECCQTCPHISPTCKEKCECWEFARKAFIAGLKAGRHKWHNLQKTPADLPLESEFLKHEPDNHRYEWFIVATTGNPYRALYSFSKKKWFIDYEEMKIGTSYFEPIAWCEIPKFEED